MALFYCLLCLYVNSNSNVIIIRDNTFYAQPLHWQLRSIYLPITCLMQILWQLSIVSLLFSFLLLQWNSNCLGLLSNDKWIYCWIVKCLRNRVNCLTTVIKFWALSRDERSDADRIAICLEMNELQNRPKIKKQVVSDEVREKAIDQLDRGMRLQEVSMVFGIKYKNLSQIYIKYKKFQQIFKKKSGHRRPKLTNQMKDYLCDLIEEDCTRRYSDLRQHLIAAYPEITTVSDSTIRRALKEFYFSFKRVTQVPERRNSADVIEARYAYAMTYTGLIPERRRIVFIDQMGVQVNSRAKYGHSVKGTKAHKSVPAIRSRTYSVCAAMMEDSLYFFEIQNVAYNSEHYSGFLVQLFNHLANDQIIGAHLIMDNVPFHHTHDVRNLVIAHGHNIVFLPPYSPFMNPIEELFHQWKSCVRRRAPLNEEQLYAAVSTSSEDITQDNCRNYFQHMESYLVKCLSREVIQS